MNDTKFFAIFIGVVAGLIAFIVFLAGLPNYEYYHFEKSGIVCKKWHDTWSLNYDQNKCWSLEETQNANKN